MRIITGAVLVLAAACMRFAVGDANVDGRLDLLVTNFLREASALYQQQPVNTELAIVEGWSTPMILPAPHRTSGVE